MGMLLVNLANNLSNRIYYHQMEAGKRSCGLFLFGARGAWSVAHDTS